MGRPELLKSTSQKGISNTIAVVKLASILFCTISLSDNIFGSSIESRENFTYNPLSIPAILTSTLILIYLLWWFFTIKIHTYKHIKTVRIIESFVFILIYSISIFFMGAFQSNLKFLFLFIIIISTIEINEVYGILIAFISSFIILAADLIYGPNVSVNQYFQNDLILAGVFILIAWTLGHYVAIEREKIEQKNLQLEVMDKELKESSKHREYMEELLSKEDNCYNLLIDNSNDTIIVHRNGEIIFGNESSARFLGIVNFEELAGKSIFEFITKDEQENVKPKLISAFNERNSTLSFEHKVKAGSGSSYTVRNTSTFFIYKGEPTVLSILHDITPEKQVEKLQEDVKKGKDLLEETREFNKLITEFFSNISHELKTPLNVIFSAIQLLNHYKENSIQDLEEKQDKYFKIMKQNCYRLMRLINNLLDMTRLDSGFLKLNMVEFNIINVVEDIVMSVAPYIESKGIGIIFDTDVEERTMVFDPDKIERIILNLLSNAVKFTECGGEIFVNITNTEKEIFISVKDTGAGIPEDKLSMIFDRFMQVDKTMVREHEGSGIGLSLVKSFVEMHKGTVVVKSKLGCGSEFIVKLPVNLLHDKVTEQNNYYESNIERINIEFSDIYSEINM